MTPRQRGYAAFIILAEILLAAGLVYAVWATSPPTNADQWKEFGVKAGVILTFVGSLATLSVSLFTLSTQVQAQYDIVGRQLQTQQDIVDQQIQAARDLEQTKGDILTRVDTVRNSLAGDLEFLKRTMDAKVAAYNELFKAATYCYRELQLLAKGQYDPDRIRDAENRLREAEALAANLDDIDQSLVEKLMQTIFNIVDEADQCKVTVPQNKWQTAYEAIWTRYAREFGEVMGNLRDRSLFSNKSVP